MDEEFIKEQAKQFAKVTKHGASKFAKLSTLKERLEQELQPYEGKNRYLFLKFWKEELDSLFFEHFKTCPDPVGCPQHQTSKNASFLHNQYSYTKDNVDEESNLLEFSDKNDLNYYFNANNIPNQDLVFDTFNFFRKGPGKDYFDPLAFLNVLNWHYRYLTANADRPFNVLSQVNKVPVNSIQRHLLIGFILKWFGGYPVNNLNTQFNTTLKFLEAEYLETVEEAKNRKQQINNERVSGKLLSVEDTNELKELNKKLDFLHEVDEAISNKEMRLKLKNLEQELNKSLRNDQPDEEPRSVSELFIFISHSSKDEAIVKLFIDKILQLGLHISLDKIFCTSIQAATITTGEDFRTVIKEKLMKASHVIQIITSNYKESEVCLNEMGAAWVLNHKVMPFILPPITYTSVGFIHSPNQLLRLNHEDDLLKFIDEMKLDGQNLSLSEIKRHVTDFINSLEK
jgi:hypothetical protein